jgi:hypothetical protein
MTSHIEERAYRWPRRYVFAATVVLIVALLVLPFVA